MKRVVAFLMVLFVATAGWARYYRYKSVSAGIHSAFDICNSYKGLAAVIIYIDHVNTLEEAKILMEYNLNTAKEKSTVNYVEKPYKNEVDSAFELLQEHYEPLKGELYQVETYKSKSCRIVFIWIKDEKNFYYWVYESYY